MLETVYLTCLSHGSAKLMVFTQFQVINIFWCAPTLQITRPRTTLTSVALPGGSLEAGVKMPHDVDDAMSDLSDDEGITPDEVRRAGPSLLPTMLRDVVYAFNVDKKENIFLLCSLHERMPWANVYTPTPSAA
jgi:hypothetical protein